MAAIGGRDEPASQGIIDAALADSFPASRPVSWTLGRERYRSNEQGYVEERFETYGRGRLHGQTQHRSSR